MTLHMKRCLLIIVMLVQISDARRSLRNYIVLNQYPTQSQQNQCLVYDQSEEDLLCFLESSSVSSPLFNYSVNSLVLFPSYQIVASMEKLQFVSSNHQTTMSIFDDQFNVWMSGRIAQMNSLQSFRFRIGYNKKIYIMENRFASSITEIRNVNNTNSVLTRFYQRKLAKPSKSSKYKIEIYTNDLPDPIYILALNLLDSVKMKSTRM